MSDHDDRHDDPTDEEAQRQARAVITPPDPSTETDEEREVEEVARARDNQATREELAAGDGEADD